MKNESAMELPEVLTDWLLNYGSFAIFGLLALGIIALPVPEETLLVFTGFLIQQEKFMLIPTVLAAYLGSITGITVSYLIGRTGGLYVIKKYGPYVGINDVKMEKAHSWFEHYGKWILFIGYFIPGLRHFTGVFAGMSTLEYAHFCVFAYSGALVWVSTFLSIGYFFGNFHQEAFELIESNVEAALTTFILFVLAVIGVVIWRKNRSNEN